MTRRKSQVSSERGLDIEFWYDDIGGWLQVFDVVKPVIKAVPYTFCYGNRFNAIQEEIAITTDTWRGTISLSDGAPQAMDINGFFFEGDIQFTKRFPDKSYQVYTGSVNLNIQPPTMQGAVVTNPPPVKVGPMPVFRWSAQKQS